MPRYDYSCDRCGIIEYKQGYHDDAYTVCPRCGSEEFRREISIPTIFDQTPRTVGGVADKNSKTLGSYYKESERQKYIEGKLKASAYMGTIPDHASVAERKEYIPKWRTGPIDKSLAKLNDDQKERFIMTGKK